MLRGMQMGLLQPKDLFGIEHNIYWCGCIREHLTLATILLLGRQAVDKQSLIPRWSNCANTAPTGASGTMQRRVQMENDNTPWGPACVVEQKREQAAYVDTLQ